MILVDLGETLCLFDFANFISYILPSTTRIYIRVSSTVTEFYSNVFEQRWVILQELDASLVNDFAVVWEHC